MAELATIGGALAAFALLAPAPSVYVYVFGVRRSVGYWIGFEAWLFAGAVLLLLLSNATKWQALGRLGRLFANSAASFPLLVLAASVFWNYVQCIWAFRPESGVWYWVAAVILPIHFAERAVEWSFAASLLRGRSRHERRWLSEFQVEVANCQTMAKY